MVYHDERHHEHADHKGYIASSVTDALCVIRSYLEFLGYVEEGDGELSVLESIVLLDLFVNLLSNLQ
jgi:hypothetical protein